GRARGTGGWAAAGARRPGQKTKDYGNRRTRVYGSGGARPMSSRGRGRWDGNIHYYDYKPDALGRDTSRIDAWIVAEAFIYDDGRKTEKVAITELASGEDLEI